MLKSTILTVALAITVAAQDAGQPCADGACNPGLFCDAANGNTCQALSLVNPGEPCDATLGTVCDGTIATCIGATCKIGAGQDCTNFTSECIADHSCIGGICAANEAPPTEVNPGEPCDEVTTICTNVASCISGSCQIGVGGDCTGFTTACIAGHTCTDNMCTADQTPPTTVNPGQNCDGTTTTCDAATATCDDAGVCKLNSGANCATFPVECIADHSCIEDVCAPTPTPPTEVNPGEPCDEVTTICTSVASCISGSCQIGVGGDCTGFTTACITGHTCTDNMCTADQTPGTSSTTLTVAMKTKGTDDFADGTTSTPDTNYGTAKVAADISVPSCKSIGNIASWISNENKKEKIWVYFVNETCTGDEAKKWQDAIKLAFEASNGNEASEMSVKSVSSKENITDYDKCKNAQGEFVCKDEIEGCEVIKCAVGHVCVNGEQCGTGQCKQVNNDQPGVCSGAQQLAALGAPILAAAIFAFSTFF